MSSEKKDYSLLRPFDLEAAKRGARLCWTEHGTEAEFIAGPDRDGEICVRHVIDNTLLVRRPDLFSIAPLCWVEGKPVYKGGRLYVDGYSGNVGQLGSATRFEGQHLHGTWDTGCTWMSRVEFLSWNPPMVKREGWAVIRVCGISKTRQEAEEILKQHVGTNPLSDLMAGEPRVVRIEWEEPAGGAQ